MGYMDRHTVNVRALSAVAMFASIWPEATIIDLARALPLILGESCDDRYDNMSFDQAAQCIMLELHKAGLLARYIEVTHLNGHKPPERP